MCGIPLPEDCGNPIACPRRSSRRPPRRAAGTTSTSPRPTRPGTWANPALVERLRTLTLELYRRASAHAESRGIILADTKFEFGLTDAGELLLIDEALTPDSSRFWPADQYKPGGPQPSFDKQFVRDYLEAIKWNKQPPVPSLPDDVVERTRAKYLEAFERLTGSPLAV